MDRCDVAIIGAGVIGLAVAAEISKKNRNVVLLEKESSFGQHTSSRNSEVIHAGIYYPKDSLKAKLCVEGNGMLYDFCGKYSVPHARLGKLIVALNEDEITQLEGLNKQAEENGVSDLRWLTATEIKMIEPAIKAEKALFSPSTGIIDSHILMKTLEGQSSERGALISYGSEVTGIKKSSAGYEIEVNRQDRFETKVVINAAGLFSDRIAAMAGIDTMANHYQLHYYKGEYFSYSKPSFLKHLVYPVPEQDIKGLGIHAVLDLAGGLRFGPNAEYVDEIDYRVDPAHREMFFHSIKDLYPMVNKEELLPDQAGIRPKLQGPGQGFRDFVIKEESANGLPGFINLIGIESPGLTASLAIAVKIALVLDRHD